MKKAYLLFVLPAALIFASCGGEEKKEKKKDQHEATEEETEENAEDMTEEPAIDYSYVLPAIDTASLTDEPSLIDAMTKVTAARRLDDSLSSHVAGYNGYYTELLQLQTAVMTKGNEYMSTLKSKDAIAFSEKFSAAQN